MADRFPAAVDEQQLPPIHRLDVPAQQSGEERGQIDDAPVAALGRGEVAVCVHILVHRPDPGVDLVPRRTALAGRKFGLWQVQERAAHRAHLAPTHPGERPDHHHQRELPLQTLAHVQQCLEFQHPPGAHRDRRVPGTAAPGHLRGHCDQALYGGIAQQVAQHAHDHRHARAGQAPPPQIAGEARQIQARDLADRHVGEPRGDVVAVLLRIGLERRRRQILHQEPTIPPLLDRDRPFPGRLGLLSRIRCRCALGDLTGVREVLGLRLRRELGATAPVMSVGQQPMGPPPIPAPLHKRHDTSPPQPRHTHGHSKRAGRQPARAETAAGSGVSALGCFFYTGHPRPWPPIITM